MLHDIDVYLARHQRLRSAATARPRAPFTRNDIYALNALKDQFVGEGGGDEAVRLGVPRRAAAQARRQRRGYASGTTCASPTTPRRPRASRATSASSRRPRATPATSSSTRAAYVGRDRRRCAARCEPRAHASNELMVSGAALGDPPSDHGRRPADRLLLPGPDVGDRPARARASASAARPRRRSRATSSSDAAQDFAWSLTRPASTRSTPTSRRCAATAPTSTCSTASAGRCSSSTPARSNGHQTQQITFYRTVHGPVFGYARVHGRLVALVAQALELRQGRARPAVLPRPGPRPGAQRPPVLQGREPDAADVQLVLRRRQGHRRVHQRPAADPPVQRRPGAADRRHAARRSGSGYVSAKNHPQGINPPNGEIVNWNNRPQAGLRGPRRQLVAGRAAARRPADQQPRPRRATSRPRRSSRR